MSLNLDPRQRAMLRDMGVRVWLPAAAPVESSVKASNAINAIATHADSIRANNPFNHQHAEAQPAAPRVAPPPRTPVRPAGVPPSSTQSGATPAAWKLGPAQPLFADSAKAQGARWLVLAESPAAALSADPFHGDAGKLLGNMLRAARLPQAGAVLFAPLARLAASGSAADVMAELSALIASARPDLLLVMGRLAAQALLRSTEPFGKLRGRVHSLDGVNSIVTYDAAYLLRTPADKARAWDDLCLAMSLVPGGLARPV